METHHVGKAIVQDNDTDLLFVIPTRKSLWSIIYTGLWLCLWLVGEIPALMAVLAGYSYGFGGLLWLLVWTIGGLFVFRSLLWSLIGKEFIAIDKDTLIIERKGLLLSTPKQYDTSKVRDVRVQQDKGGYVGQFVVRKDFLNAGSDGIIRFDYEKQTIKFAAGIDKADALQVIQEMKERHYLTESNFGSAGI